MHYKPAAETLTRRKANFRIYDFRCECECCQMQKKLQASALIDGGDLMMDVHCFVAFQLRDEEPWGERASAARLAEGKRIMSRINPTYDKCAYGTLSRLAGIQISSYLLAVEISTCQAQMSSKPNLITTATRLLRDL